MTALNKTMAPSNLYPRLDRNGSMANVQPSINDEVADDQTEEVERGKWGSKWEFVLSCVGLSVGIGNVWRFPYLAYSNGGGAFLIPYVILLLLVGKPMYYMEVAIGQFSQLGPLGIWKLSPLFTGVGISMITVSLIVSIYYNVIMAYTIFYTAASFSSELPWASCQEWWGADQFCFSRTVKTNETYTYYDIDEQVLYYNGTPVCKPQFNDSGCVNVTLQTASKQYWEKYVLSLKPDGLTEFGDLGIVKWELLLCFALSWLIVFLCVMKGVKSSGKVVYFTATFPYVILISILIRGVTLDGAMIGISYFFVPVWEQLLDLQVWRKAAEQMFYSLSISWGGLILFGSYNEFRNKVHIDAFVVSFLDLGTSIIAGIATFSILGAISLETGVDIKDIASSGPGFAFITFPEALTRLPLPQLWAVLFFIMLYLLGLDTQFALVELCLTSIYDNFPKLRKKKLMVTAIAVACLFLLGIPCLTEAGTYVIEIMDVFGGGSGVMLVSIFEMVGIMWFYGVRKFSADLRFMLGVEPSFYWKVCWAFCSPIFLVAIFAFSMTAFKEPKMGPNDYPPWAIQIGWVLLFSVILPIPITAVYKAIQYWRRGEISKVIKPDESWGPGEKSLRAEWLRERQRAFPDKSKETGPVKRMNDNCYENGAIELG